MTDDRRRRGRKKKDPGNAAPGAAETAPDDVASAGAPAPAAGKAGGGGRRGPRGPARGAAPERPGPGPAGTQALPPEPVFLCDLCGSPMLERHCRLICARCGYQRDCTDP